MTTPTPSPGLPGTRSRVRQAAADGVWTLPVALVLAALAFPVDRITTDTAPLLARVGAVVLALACIVIGWSSARVALVRRRRLVVARTVARTRLMLGYLVAAVVVAAVAPDIDDLALWLGALAMTSPGLATVVLDGSTPPRATVRVLLAAGMAVPAVGAGFLAGFLGFAVAGPVGAMVGGLGVGHLVTFVPLAVVGPGDRVRAD